MTRPESRNTRAQGRQVRAISMPAVPKQITYRFCGIGCLMVKGQSNISTAIVMSGMIAIGIVGVTIDVLLRALQARIERHRQI
jgi:ABC-type nitrate/sulfonate/bicarbonate transport system permease component